MGRNGQSVHLYLSELANMEKALQALLDGVDPEANFRIVLNSIYPQMLSFFLRKGVPMEEARELTQDVSMSIHKGIGHLHDLTVFRGWAFAIARNAYINYLERRNAIKREGESHTAPIESIVERTPDGQPDQLDRLLASERVQQLRVAISELPPKMQQCVRIRILEDAPYDAIACRLGISVNTVKAQLFQARQHLNKRLRGVIGEVAL